MSGFYLEQIASPFRMISFHSLCVPGGLTDHKEEVNLQEIWYQDLAQLLSCTGPPEDKNQHEKPLTGLLWCWILSSRAFWTEYVCIVFNSSKWGEDCSHIGYFWGWDFASNALSDHLYVPWLCHLSWRGRANKLQVRSRIFCTCSLESRAEIRGSNLGMTNLQTPVNEGPGQIPPSLCCVHFLILELPSQWLPADMSLWREGAPWHENLHQISISYITEGQAPGKPVTEWSNRVVFCTSSNISVTDELRMWVLDHRVEKMHKAWTFHFVLTNFSIISVNQSKINNVMELLSCPPSVLPMCDSTGCHLQRHLLRQKCWGEIQLCGKTPQISRWWCWRWACMSLLKILTLSPSHTHILFGVNQFFWCVGTLRNSYLHTNWATTQKELCCGTLSKCS